MLVRSVIPVSWKTGELLSFYRWHWSLFYCVLYSIHINNLIYNAAQTVIQPNVPVGIQH